MPKIKNLRIWVLVGLIGVFAGLYFKAGKDAKKARMEADKARVAQLIAEKETADHKVWARAKELETKEARHVAKKLDEALDKARRQLSVRSRILDTKASQETPSDPQGSPPASVLVLEEGQPAPRDGIFLDKADSSLITAFLEGETRSSEFIFGLQGALDKMGTELLIEQQRKKAANTRSLILGGVVVVLGAAAVLM